MLLLAGVNVNFLFGAEFPKCKITRIVIEFANFTAGRMNVKLIQHVVASGGMME